MKHSHYVTQRLLASTLLATWGFSFVGLTLKACVAEEQAKAEIYYVLTLNQLEYAREAPTEAEVRKVYFASANGFTRVHAALDGPGEARIADTGHNQVY